MSDVSGRYDASSPPPPSSAPPAGPPRRDDRVSAGQGDAFQAALRDARGHDDDDEVQDRGSRRGDDDKRKAKRSLGEGAVGAGSAKGLTDGLARFGPVHARAQDDHSDLSGMAQHTGGLAAAESPAEPEAAGQVDPVAFARMVDEAATQVQAAPPGQTLKLEFTDLRAPLQGVQVTRAPDGSVSLALNASADQVAEVSRSLQALRRRLEARGLDVAELTLGAEADGLAPVKGGAL